jgi:hypothetical protein
MALTVTFDEYQVQLGLYADDKAAGDLDAALVHLDNAIAIRAALPDTVSIPGGTATLMNMAQLLAVKESLQDDMVEAAKLAARGRGRVIGAGVQHSSGAS